MRSICLTLCLLFSPSLALANIGLPMLVFAWPGMFVGLIPVIAIEGFYLRKQLGIALKKSLKVTAIANLESTGVGIPLSWGGLVVVEMFLAYIMHSLGIGKLPDRMQDFIYRVFSVTLGAAWLGPDEKNAYWLIPTAATVLLIPFFFVSVWCEGRSLHRQIPELEKAIIKQAVLKANFITYVLMAIACIMWLIIAINKKSI